MQALTCIGIHWLWLALPWSLDGDAGRWLLNAVVVVCEERNALRNVIRSHGVAITVKVRRNKRLRRILWALDAILVSRPLPQTVCVSSPGQVAHYCVVLWIQQRTKRSYNLHIKNCLCAHLKTEIIKCFLCAPCCSPESLLGQKAHCPLQATPYRQQHSVYVVLCPWRGSAHMLSLSRRCQQISMCTSWSGSRGSGR